MSVNTLLPVQGNNLSDTLSTSIGSGDLTIPVNSISIWSSSGGKVIIDRGLVTQEIVATTGKSGSSLTVPSSGRGQEGTSAQGHNSGATVESVPFAGDYNNVITALTNVVKASDGTVDTSKVVTPSTLTDANLVTTDVTTNNVSTSKHGFAPKAPNDATKFLNGTGAYSVPSGSSTDGWLADSNTWVYASASTFTIAGVDVTAQFKVGTSLKFTQTTVKYAVVASSSFSTNTTVTILVNTDYTLANAAITANYYSYQVNPQGFPAGFAFTPGSITGWSASPTVNVARYSTIGRICVLRIDIQGTSNATSVSFTIPMAATNTGGNDEGGTMSLAQDNGSILTGASRLVVASTTVTCFKDMSGAAWTNTAAKRVQFISTFEW